MTSVLATRTATPARKRRTATITPVAWTASGEMDLAEWVAAGRSLGAIGRCSQWWLADWIRYGNARFGERYARAAAITGYDPQTLMNMVYVASRFDFSRRREKLSWSHHEAVASLEQDRQERWLNLATERKLSVADLRLELRSRRGPHTKGSEGDLAPVDDTTWVCPKCGQGVSVISRVR
jgi:hypothetical protein